MKAMSNIYEWIDIYSPRTGEKLCRIQTPQNTKTLLLGFKTVWKHSIVIERWAWQQAYTNVARLTSMGINKEGSQIPTTLSFPCIACNQNTVRSAVSWWNARISHQLMHRPYKLIGFQCWNDKCNVFQVLIPMVLHEHIDEIPKEFLQDRFGLYLKQEDKRLEELISQYGFTSGTELFKQEISQMKSNETNKPT